jgi:hypothetical protein
VELLAESTWESERQTQSKSVFACSRLERKDVQQGAFSNLKAFKNPSFIKQQKIKHPNQPINQIYSLKQSQEQEEPQESDQRH